MSLRFTLLRSRSLHRIYLRSVVLALATLIPSLALAQSAVFDIMAGDKKVGKDTYTLSKAKQGYKLVSRYSYHLASADNYSDALASLEGSSTNSDTQLMTPSSPTKPVTSSPSLSFRAVPETPPPPPSSPI